MDWYVQPIKHNDIDPDTGKNLITRYLHLEPGTLKFTTNKTVSKGTTIATSGKSGATGYHLHFDVNAKGMTYPGDYDTFSPWVFWPEKRPSLLNIDLGGDTQGQHEEKFDDPEYFFDFLLIDYVGKDEFFRWMDSIEESECTMTNFKKYFKLTEKDINKIMKTSLSPEREKKILGKS